MWQAIPPSMLARMHALETLDRAQRAGSAPPETWLRAIPPELGRVLALLAASAPAGAVVELGTSGGYSTLWLTLALSERPIGGRVITIEKRPDKHALAGETFALAGVSHLVEQRLGDAASEIATLDAIAFAFVDHGPANYQACREALVSRLVPGALVAVDNVTSHRELAAPFVAAMLQDPRLDATVLELGKGLLVARRRTR